MTDGAAASLASAGDFKAQRLKELLDSDAQIRASMPSAEVNEAKRAQGLNLAQIVDVVMRGYADRPALARRASEVVVDAESGRRLRRLLPHFETLSYGELWSRSRALASMWHCDAVRPLRAGDMMCLIAFAGMDFATVDLAAIHNGAVVVPLQTNGQMSQLLGIVQEVEPRWLCSSLECLDTSVQLVLQGHRPLGLLVFDYDPGVDDDRQTFERARQALADAGLTDLLLTLDDALRAGAAGPQAPVYAEPDTSNRMSTLYYTSGSTGLPKGAMYPERNLRSTWLRQATLPTLYLHYMPMNHGFGRGMGLFSVLAAGGTCYFTGRSDLSELFHDLREVRPTVMGMVPRVCEMLYQRFKVEWEKHSPGAADDQTRNRALKTGLILEMRQQMLGGRMLTGTFAAAALAPELRQFMAELLGFEMDDVYGATEVPGLTLNGRFNRPPVIDYKLDDVPELGYFKTDKPYPRGELWVKSGGVMLGYYKRPELTAQVMTEDGYYKTGDIMAELGPDQVVYVDRRNNVLKLAQGEFVAIARLEALFTNGHPLIRQAFLYGSSQRSFLLGVLVPNLDVLASQGIAADDLPALQRALREALQEVARKEDLHAYEVPRDFILELEPFSAENGLLSGIGKHLRPRFVERYGPRLDQMYDDMARSQADELAALRRQGQQAPVLQTVAKAVQATLGLAAVDAEQRASFAELGGDSLSALSCSLLLEEIFGIEVPAHVVNNPSGSLAQIAAFIERARAGVQAGSPQPTFASVHGRGATEIRAADLVLTKFLDTETLAAAAHALPARSQAEALRCVLVTGANGFLGRFLCLDWLERMAAVDGRVVCIVRGRDEASARARLAEVFDSGDAALKARFESLAQRHLQLLCGDLAEPRLGLGDADWQRLAESVDLIVHPAALVNHVLPYQALFGPNVLGTAELIRLAITHRLKPIINVSTTAAARLPDGSSIDEDADVRVATPVRMLDIGRYAEGYAHSKWAGEVLLRDAHDRFGLPVSVFRSDMILAHSRWQGQINVPDMFTRWVFSVAATGLAPASFYAGDASRAHYDGLPVDFSAEAVSRIGIEVLSGYRSYHVVNPHDDGLSMDSFVDWMIEAGERVERLPDYGQWLERFETALRGLPESQRQQSSLPLLHNFKRPLPVHAGASVSSQRFRADVRRLGLGSEGEIPKLSKTFIMKYLSDLKILGMLQSHSTGR